MCYIPTVSFELLGKTSSRGKVLPSESGEGCSTNWQATCVCLPALVEAGGAEPWSNWWDTFLTDTHTQQHTHTHTHTYPVFWLSAHVLLHTTQHNLAELSSVLNSETDADGAGKETNSTDLVYDENWRLFFDDFLAAT